MNGTMMQQEICQSAAGLRAAKKKNAETIKNIVKAVKKKKVAGVVIAARGTSNHAGIFAKYLIETHCGVPVSIAAPSVYTVYSGNLCLKNFLVIGLSQSGQAADAIEVIKHAKACGAVTVAVTNDPASPMAAEAEFTLDCAQGPELSVAATKTFISQLYLVLMLAAAWSKNENLKAALRTSVLAVEKTYKLSEIIEQSAMRYRFINDSFVLGRGLAYPVAVEFALKTQETSYIRSRGYSTSDFYHGPIAQVSEGTPVFLFALSGALKQDSINMISRLKQSGGDIFVFSSDIDILAMADAGVALPEYDEIPSVFAAAAAMQLFSCSLAVLRGRNPDKPRGLSKVTITK